MSYTAARVSQGGSAYQVLGSRKHTTTDVTVTTNSETVTAADLGLNAVFFARADVLTGQATDTGTYANATVASGSNQITLAEFTAAGVAATTATGTVLRVYASGY